MRIWFDMDGTIADLYGVDNWLAKLNAKDETPYAEAKPIVNLSLLARLMNKVQRNGFEVCIISALSKETNADYDTRVKNAKTNWLAKHLKSVHFNEIRFVPYDFIKNEVNTGDDLLFDDEERHLQKWTGTAYHAKDILKVLKQIA